jgi:excisionase family DNA binding protein
MLTEVIKEKGRTLSPGEVAPYFGVAPKTVVRWATQGIIPYFVTPGGHHRFWENDVLTVLDLDRHDNHPLFLLARRIVALDDVDGPGAFERRTVSLNDIITWAQEALEESRNRVIKK